MLPGILLLATQVQLGDVIARVGSIDDDRQALSNVMRVVEDPGSGRIFVFERDNARVPVYDADGTFVTRLGRRGGGPGEFVAPVNARFSDERVWIADVNLRKFSLFDRNSLRHDRDVVLPPTQGRSAPFTMDAAGRVVLTEHVGEVWQWKSNDHVVWSYADERDVVRLELAGRYVTFLQPFGESPRLLPTLDGGGILSIQTDEPELRVLRLGLSGDTLIDRILPIEAVTVTDAMFDDAVAEISRSLSHLPLSRSSIERAVRDHVQRPGATHGITGVSIGPDNVLWIGSDAGGGNTWWAVDARAGSLIGAVTLPRGQQVETGSRAHVWILEKDALDVPYLVKYRLEWESPNGRIPNERPKYSGALASGGRARILRSSLVADPVHPRPRSRGTSNAGGFCGRRPVAADSAMQQSERCEELPGARVRSSPVQP